MLEEDNFNVLTTTCGTPGYMAPEIFKKAGHGKPVDVWAIGVITCVSGPRTARRAKGGRERRWRDSRR